MPTVTIQDGSTAVDTYVNQAAAATNYGTNATLYVGDTATLNQARRTLIKPNLSGIPSGSKIISATLELLVSASSGAGTPTFSVYRVTSDWTEGAATWNAQPTLDSTAIASLVLSTGGWKSWNVTSLVQAWVSGQTNYGAVLKKATDGTTANDFRGFYSSDDTTATNRPKWTITYEAPSSGRRGYNVTILGRKGRGILTF